MKTEMDALSMDERERWCWRRPKVGKPSIRARCASGSNRPYADGPPVADAGLSEARLPPAGLPGDLGLRIGLGRRRIGRLEGTLGVDGQRVQGVHQ